MKRFYKTVTTGPLSGGHGVFLDGRPIKTPARRDLLLPGAALAAAIADEWRAQGDKIDPAAMPLTKLANNSLDRVARESGRIADQICKYGETDLVCYRADYPESLVERQRAEWDPLLAWVGERHGAALAVTEGVMHVEQPPEALAALRQAIEGYDAFTLTGFAEMVSAAGSFVIALAVAEGRLDPEAAWRAAVVDEAHQAEQWGTDSEAEKAQALRKSNFLCGYELVKLTKK